MGLKEELNLEQPIKTLENECLLNIVYTGTMLSKLSYKYFSAFGITDAQFNLLTQLKYSKKKVLSQVNLSRQLVVNKADMTGLIDRLSKAGYVERVPHPTDRRINLIKTTKKGLEKVNEIEPNYLKKVKKLLKNLAKPKLKQTIVNLEHVRKNIKNEGLR
jgi:DNA-binding MarR family transcriptional regulator